MFSCLLMNTEWNTKMAIRWWLLWIFWDELFPHLTVSVFFTVLNTCLMLDSVWIKTEQKVRITVVTFLIWLFCYDSGIFVFPGPIWMWLELMKWSLKQWVNININTTHKNIWWISSTLTMGQVRPFFIRVWTFGCWVRVIWKIVVDFGQLLPWTLC